ncbi:MAG: hypothetical protein GF310_09225, partial [candidate division Zixibacteria bacterium]|nr:hypothetical protein [candidate division Zixibacteria bacterium]
MNKTPIISITILMLLLSGASLIAQDQYKIVLNDGTKIVGTIKNTEFPIDAEFADMTVQAKHLHSFKNGRFNFTDGSIIMGQFMPCTLDVDASLGALSLDISKVASIAPACYLKESFDNAQLDRTIWNKPPVALAVKNGMLQTTYSNGKVFVATKNKYGNGVYTVCIKSTGDGHTMPNINFMRNENTMDWGWRGYNFHFSLFDKVITLRNIDGGGNARLWVSAK